MDLNLIAAIIVFICITSAALVNVYKIAKKQVDPTLSSWVIFFIATVMSLGTYFLNGDGGFVAGALNISDLLSTSTIMLSIIFLGSRKWVMRSYEKFYLLGLLIVGVFWAVTSNSFVSNLLIQTIIAIGYIPTIHTLIKSKKNTESFTVWGFIMLASIVSLYPSINSFLANGDVLSVVYSVRSIVLLGIVMTIMFVYARKNN